MAVRVCRESDLPADDGMLAFVRSLLARWLARAAARNEAAAPRGSISRVSALGARAVCALALTPPARVFLPFLASAQEAEGRSLLLVRHRDALYAIDAHCFHMARSAAVVARWGYHGVR
jgi:hypothetical protein